jgi:hypothetical protein
LEYIPRCGIDRINISYVRHLRRFAVHEWFDADLFSRMAENGRILYIGPGFSACRAQDVSGETIAQQGRASGTDRSGSREAGRMAAASGDQRSGVVSDQRSLS